MKMVNIANSIINETLGSAGFYNFLAIIFNHTIKIFDIEYGEVKGIIELEER